MVTLKCNYGDIMVIVKEARIDFSLVSVSRWPMDCPFSLIVFRM